MMLVGDVGGTNVRFALYDYDGDNLQRLTVRFYETSKYNSIEEIIHLFLNETECTVNTAVIGVPGPVFEGKSKVTNVDWELDQTVIQQRCSFREVRMINDLVATTASLPWLPATSCKTLYHGNGAQSSSMRVVLAPGTGLGLGILLYDGKSWRVFPSEGGHVDFGPRNINQIGLLEFLLARYGRVSYEQVMSGPGLLHIYQYLVAQEKHQEPDELIFELSQVADKVPLIAELALMGKYDICIEALDIFCSVIASQAGNIALMFIPGGGVYLGGGIPPKIINKLCSSDVLKTYLDKPPMSHVVERIPLHTIMDDTAALLGAAAIGYNLIFLEPQ